MLLSMSDDPVPTTADTEGDEDTHDVPTELVEVHEALDYLNRTELGPNGDA